MKKAVIFDVDGTLWDACGVIADSWNEYIRLYAPGINPGATEELVRSLCGQTMDRFAAAMFPAVEPGKAMALTDACCVYEVDYLHSHSGTLYPDLEETLQTLKEAGYPLYIVSNCQTGYVEVFLEQSGFGSYFEDIEYFGRTGRQKGENIRLLCERNHIDEAVYLGDTQGDMNASAEAGVQFVHAAYGFGSVGSDVPSINTLKEFPQKVAVMLGDSICG